MKKDQFYYLLFISVACILGLFYMLAQGADWERDGFVLIVFGCSVVSIVVIFFLLFLLIDTWKHKKAAIKAMGKDGLLAVVKDKVAKTAFKGISALLDSKYIKAEENLMKAYHLSDVRNNQLFCIEWLIRLYEALENSNSVTLDTDGKLMWCYRRAAELASDSPEAQSRLGHAYYVEGKLDKALHCFEQAIKYDPNHGYSHYSIAKIYACRGEDEKAVEVLEKLLELQENHPLVYSELATIYAMHNSVEKAQEYYQKAIMCGYDDPERLSRRMTAIYDFNQAEDTDGSDLPHEYYRRIQTEEESKPACSSSCEHCDLNKKCAKEENDAGNE